MAANVSDGVTKEIVTAPAPGAQKVVRGNSVTVHCDAQLGQAVSDPSLRGKKFWSTRDPGQQPFTFNCGKGEVITGWDEGCLSMYVGEKSRLTIRSDKGYGAGGFPAWNIPPNAELVFTIEVLKINK